MPAFLSCLLILVALPVRALQVSLTFTADAYDRVRFSDGYPRETSQLSSARRLLDVRGEVTPEFRAGNVVRLKFAKPLAIRTTTAGEESTSILAFLDVRLDLIQLAAVTRVFRAIPGEVAVRQTSGAWSFGHVLAHARAGAPRQDLANDLERLPKLLAVDRAEISLGHLRWRDLDAEGVRDVDRVRIRVPQISPDANAVDYVDAADFVKMETYADWDRKVARYLDVLTDVRDIRRRMSGPNVIRPDFGGRASCTDEFGEPRE